MMKIAIGKTEYDYSTIANFVERKMNSGNVHRLKVQLAVVREIMAFNDADEQDEELFLKTLQDIGYLRKNMEA